MNIIIVGCGMVGKNLVEQLNEDGNEITVIDLDADNVHTITTKYDVYGIVGNGATHKVQQNAGISNADLFIAVTGSDELNLLCCLIAKKEGHCQTIARVETPEYRKETPYLKDELGLAMIISPEYVAAKEISKLLLFPSATKIESFARGTVELIKIRIPEKSKLAGMAVRDIVSKLKSDVLICTIERDNEAYIAKADFVFKEKDIISIVASHTNAIEFIKKLGFKAQATKNVILAGSGEIGHYLCQMLPDYGINVKVIDKTPALCDTLTSEFSKIPVINADPTDNDTLLEEGVEDADAFVTLLDLDEENILLSLSAKTLCKGKIITKITKSDFDALAANLDIDTTVNPKTITSDMIIRYARATKNSLGSNVETLYNFIPGKATAAEFTVKENSPIAEKPLSQLKFKNNIIVAAIIRDKTVIIPRGNDIIIPGDSVVIVSEFMPLHDISDVLR